jgi:hypothetical protein
MSRRIITREEVAHKLREWADGRVCSEEVFRWANALYLSDDVDYTDCEGDEDSVTNEVLGVLDMLDMNLVLPEDVPIYLEFLSTPAGKFQTGYAEFRRRIDEIDHESRSRRLRDVPPYARVLQHQKGYFENGSVPHFYTPSPVSDRNSRILTFALAVRPLPASCENSPSRQLLHSVRVILHRGLDHLGNFRARRRPLGGAARASLHFHFFARFADPRNHDATLYFMSHPVSGAPTPKSDMAGCAHQPPSSRSVAANRG